MDMTTIVVAASIPSAFTGFCFWLIEQNLKKRADNEKEEREERQKQLDEREQMEEGVKGYFEFIQKPRYKNLKGVTDPKKYLQLIKADGYATDSSYVESTYRLVTQYELTEYDAEGGINMKINIIKQTGTHGLYSTGRGKDKPWNRGTVWTV